MPIRSNPTYPYRYATSIVEAFTDKYARATNFVAKLYGVPAQVLKLQLIHTFMKKNNKWNVARDLIKWVEKTNQYGYLSKLGVENAQKYLSSVKTIIEDYELFEKYHYSDIDSTLK